MTYTFMTPGLEDIPVTSNVVFSSRMTVDANGTVDYTDWTPDTKLYDALREKWVEMYGDPESDVIKERINNLAAHFTA